MTKKEREAAELALVAALHRWAAAHARKLVVGAELVARVPDLTEELEVTVRVRHRATLEDVTAYRQRAMDWVTTKESSFGRDYPNLYNVARCRCSLRRKAAYSRHREDCRGKVVAVVVYRSHQALVAHPAPAHEGYLFVCQRHREAHHIEARNILAVVELPAWWLDQARKLHEQEHAKWLAELDRKDREREAAEAAKGGTP